MPCLNCTCKRCFKYYTKKKETDGQISASPEVKIMLDKFYEINPFINFANKGHRAAAEELISKLGGEKALQVVDYAISVQGQEFAPSISTPFQLKEKFNALMRFYKEQKPVGGVVQL